MNQENHMVINAQDETRDYRETPVFDAYIECIDNGRGGFISPFEKALNSEEYILQEALGADAWDNNVPAMLEHAILNNDATALGEILMRHARKYIENCAESYQ